VAHRAAAEAVYEDLAGEEQVLDLVGKAVTRIAAHPPLEGLHDRLRSVAAELADRCKRGTGGGRGLEEDPERLAEVVARRALLRELRRKYAGPGGNLADVLTFQEDADKRLDELEGLEGCPPVWPKSAPKPSTSFAVLPPTWGTPGEPRRRRW